MTNEKAKEIATRWKAKGLPYNAIYDTAIEAMQWKDEEHAKEKQQWIDKACEYWKKELIFPSMSESMKICSQVKINIFKKAMEGE